MAQLYFALRWIISFQVGLTVLVSPVLGGVESQDPKIKALRAAFTAAKIILPDDSARLIEGLQHWDCRKYPATFGDYFDPNPKKSSRLLVFKKNNVGGFDFSNFRSSGYSYLFKEAHFGGCGDIVLYQGLSSYRKADEFAYFRLAVDGQLLIEITDGKHWQHSGYYYGTYEPWSSDSSITDPYLGVKSYWVCRPIKKETHGSASAPAQQLEPRVQEDPDDPSNRDAKFPPPDYSKLCEAKP